MTSTMNRPVPRVTIGEAVTRLMPGGVPFRFTAYDGSAAGPEDSPIQLHLEYERGLSYLVTAPGDLGMARAYVSGDLTLSGVHPGNPYEAMVVLRVLGLFYHKRARQLGWFRGRTGWGV